MLPWLLLLMQPLMLDWMSMVIPWLGIPNSQWSGWIYWLPISYQKVAEMVRIIFVSTILKMVLLLVVGVMIINVQLRMGLMTVQNIWKFLLLNLPTLGRHRVLLISHHHWKKVRPIRFIFGQRVLFHIRLVQISKILRLTQVAVVSRMLIWLQSGRSLLSMLLYQVKTLSVSFLTTVILLVLSVLMISAFILLLRPRLRFQSKL